MQVITDQRSARSTAVLLLVIAVILVYLLCFHWFVVRHLDYAEEIGDLRAQLNRFQTVAAQRASLHERLLQIRDSQKDKALFLGEPEFDEAAAEVSSKIKNMVRNQANDSCQIVSRQPVRSRVQERYQKVTVNVRMRCAAGDFLQILYGMESGTPMLLVDDMNIIRPRTRQRAGVKQVPTQQLLDIRFNVAGYLK